MKSESTYDTERYAPMMAEKADTVQETQRTGVPIKEFVTEGEIPQVPCSAEMNFYDKEHDLFVICAWGAKVLEPIIKNQLLKEHLKNNPELELSWESVSEIVKWSVLREICRFSHGICTHCKLQFFDAEERVGREVEKQLGGRNER